MDESESKSYIENPTGTNPKREAALPDQNPMLIPQVKEDESKSFSNMNNDCLVTGQNFFDSNEYQNDLEKFEEEKEARGNDDYLNKINELDSIYPAIGNHNVKIN